MIGQLVVGVKADCLTWELGLQVECCIYASFEKTTENSERLGRQERPRNEHGTSRLPVFERSHGNKMKGGNKDALQSGRDRYTAKNYITT